MFNKLIIGPNNSGKSVMAERMLLDKFDKIGYFATLPKLHQYQSKIDRHQIRRNSAWVLYEAVACPERDLQALELLFQQTEAVLIDGLSTFIQRSFFTHSKLETTTYAEYIGFLQQFELVIKRKNFIIVDTLHNLSETNTVIRACVLLQDQIRNILNNNENILTTGEQV